MCPACGCSHVHKHGHYYKHHRQHCIVIYRVQCPKCGTTHALIPSCSVPGTSHDSSDVELYFKNREQGMSRLKAGAHILKYGFEMRVLKRLEKAFARSLERWLVIFGESVHSGMTLTAFAASLGLSGKEPVLAQANTLSLSRHVNALFNSRASILLFTQHKTGRRIPHKLADWQHRKPDIDSS